MVSNEVLFHSEGTRSSGLLLDLPRERAKWEWMSFSVRRLSPDEKYEAHSKTEEIGLVVLGGTCLADWGEGTQEIGKRVNVFDGFPYALYVPAGHAAKVRATSNCEIAECRVPSLAKLEPKLVAPKDITGSQRGVGNATRRIVDIMPPDFAADRLIAIEVYTPSGNWSSYPPHKHEVHNPPTEVDLDEIYYYRFQQPTAYALQRLYSTDGARDTVVVARDGDAVLIRDGYHPVVSGYGYETYYLNFLAGSERSLASTIDPDHSWVMSTW